VLLQPHRCSIDAVHHKTIHRGNTAKRAADGIDTFAHILPPRYARRLEAIVSGAGASARILGYQPWIHEDPALIDLGSRWRAVDPFRDYAQVLTLAVPPVDELGEPGVGLDLARAANDELAELIRRHPDRFAGFAAALPMSDTNAAAGELSRAMGELGAFGAGHAVRCAAEFFGRGHVLFGTDMPLGGPTVLGDTIANIEALGLPEADAAAILAGNARRLLRLPA
jgi:Amidohydrolase